MTVKCKRQQQQYSKGTAKLPQQAMTAKVCDSQTVLVFQGKLCYKKVTHTPCWAEHLLYLYIKVFICIYTIIKYIYRVSMQARTSYHTNYFYCIIYKYICALYNLKQILHLQIYRHTYERTYVKHMCFKNIFFNFSSCLFKIIILSHIGFVLLLFFFLI